MTQDVHVKLNVGLSWQKQRSARFKPLSSNILDLNLSNQFSKVTLGFAPSKVT